MIEKYTPTIQNVERTHGTIQPSILFFPSIPSILNESLSFQPTATPFPLSNHHFIPFTPFHTNTILPYPFHCISIHIHSNPSTTPPPSTHSHTTATTQFRSNTHNPFCVELGTPNINNSRKLLDPLRLPFQSPYFLLFNMSGISNFNFANPTRIVFGKGQIAQLPNLIPKDKIVYMTYGGGSIKRNGVYDQVMEALKGYEVHEFGGIEANPDFDTLKKAVYEIRKLDMSRVFLLSVGGGSICDGTKFIAGACLYKDSEDLWDMVMTHAATCKEALPMGVVLTLPAVGNEGGDEE